MFVTAENITLKPFKVMERLLLKVLPEEDFGHEL